MIRLPRLVVEPEYMQQRIDLILAHIPARIHTFVGALLLLYPPTRRLIGAYRFANHFQLSPYLYYKSRGYVENGFVERVMRNGSINAIDGFGRDLETDLEGEGYVEPDELEFSELRWGKHKKDQTIYYLHGTVPIFDTGVHIILAQYDTEHYLLQNVKDRIEKKEYPVFVTAGNGKEKLTHIMHNKYLTYCYDQLSNLQCSLIVFGFNFGEYDSHILMQ